ncbi:MAG: hypothetical protein L0H59_07015 [Tomitella sp.]|nr:hypothetical protein [Tomitella sp.]
MLDLTNPRTAHRDRLDEAVAAGYRYADLCDAGATVHDAHAAVGRSDLRLPTSGILDVPLPGAAADQIVALVPTGDFARMMLDRHTAYIRHRSLGQPVRRIATHIGTDHDRTVDYAAPIAYRCIARDLHTTSATHSDPASGARLAAIWADPDVTSEVADGPVDVFLLGNPLPGLQIPLGYEGTGGIARVLHHRLDTLRAASALKGLPSV